MPQLVICRRCGATLFESKDELRPLEDVIQMCDGKCPACKKRLSRSPNKIEVRPVDISNRLNIFEAEKKKRLRKEGRTRTKKGARKGSVYERSKPRSGGIWGTG